MNIYCKCVAVLDFLYTNKVLLSVSIGNVTVASLLSNIGTPFILMTMFVTLFFTVGSGCVTLFLNAIKNKRSKHKKVEIPTKTT